MSVTGNCGGLNSLRFTKSLNPFAFSCIASRFICRIEDMVRSAIFILYING